MIQGHPMYAGIGMGVGLVKFIDAFKSQIMASYKHTQKNVDDWLSTSPLIGGKVITTSEKVNPNFKREKAYKIKEGKDPHLKATYTTQRSIKGFKDFTMGDEEKIKIPYQSTLTLYKKSGEVKKELEGKRATKKWQRIKKRSKAHDTAMSEEKAISKYLSLIHI